jgi:hypothetical protein
MFQRYFIVFPVVILLSTFISSCSTSLIATKEVKGTQNIPPPAWVKSLTYSGYPEDRYIVGRGMAQASGNIVKDQNLADYQAFVEIANQILISIKSDISIEQIEILKDKTSDHREVTTANIFISSSVILRGLKIVDRYYDEREKIYYSLAVLDREIASIKLNPIKEVIFMKRTFPIILFLSSLNLAIAQGLKYERKSISYVDILYLSDRDIKIEDEQKKYLLKKFREYIEMQRFDYNQIPEKLVNEFKSALKSRGSDVSLDEIVELLRKKFNPVIIKILDIKKEIRAQGLLTEVQMFGENQKAIAVLFLAQ